MTVYEKQGALVANKIPDDAGQWIVLLGRDDDRWDWALFDSKRAAGEVFERALEDGRDRFVFRLNDDLVMTREDFEDSRESV